MLRGLPHRHSRRGTRLSSHCSNNGLLLTADFACLLRSRKIRIRFESLFLSKIKKTPLGCLFYFGAGEEFSAEAMPVAEKARRKKGSVPLSTSTTVDWEADDTTRAPRSKTYPVFAAPA